MTCVYTSQWRLRTRWIGAPQFLKSTVSQQVERLKTKDVSQRVEINVTPPSPVGSVSVKTSPDATLGGDHIASLDVEQVEDIDENVKLFLAI